MQDIVCQQLVELVTAHAEGVLPEHEVAAIRAHLAECDDCTLYVEQMDLTARLAGMLREGPTDAEVARLLEALRRR